MQMRRELNLSWIGLAVWVGACSGEVGETTPEVEAVPSDEVTPAAPTGDPLPQSPIPEPGVPTTPSAVEQPAPAPSVDEPPAPEPELEEPEEELLPEAPPPAAPPPTVPATGIRLVELEANQAIGVALAEDGEWIDPGDRRAPIIAGRPLLFRAFWELDGDFDPRRIEAQLTLSYADGSEVIRREVKLLSEEPDRNRLDGTFSWLLEPDEVQAEMQVAVGLYEEPALGTPPEVEAEPSPEPVDPELPEPVEPNPAGQPTVEPSVEGVRIPTAGTVPLEVDGTPRVMTIVTIPLLSESGAPIVSPARIDRLRESVFDHYPVQDVIVELRDPVEVDNSGSENQLFGALREACEEDNAPSHHFYHMIVNREDGGFSYAGVASGRVQENRTCRGLSLTFVRPDDDIAVVNGNLSTYVHELGHNVGRSHIPCGTSGDDSFPYEDGDIGAQGFSLSERTFRNREDYHEMMGYCRPRWISDWQFSQLAGVLEEIQSWGQELRTGPLGRSLTGYLGDGPPHWILDEGSGEMDLSLTPSRFAEFVGEDGSVHPAPLSIEKSSSGRTQTVTVDLPDGFSGDTARVFIDGVVHAVDLTELEAR